MDTALPQIIGVLLFVGLQFLVYKIYQRTNQTLLALIPNFVLLALAIVISMVFVLSAIDTALWRLTMFLLILATIVGFGSSTFVSLMIIYFIRKRKNQPLQK
jgi:hypothetical protein